MNWLKKLFGKKPANQKPNTITYNYDEKEAAEKYALFDIEHIPVTNRFYPRCSGLYIYWWNSSQKYTLEYEKGGCKFAESKAGAKKIIDEYLVFIHTESKILKVDD